jgi:uncharacterized protein YyaL (SSP411 family)
MNLLKKSHSPYLLLHAENPVEWYPWGKEALQKANAENKPILLSIGYAACHWCHVMAHESFEDQKTAELMNQWFVNIKVDREERPDLDKIYQLSHQLLTGQPGGWPLTIFLTPDKQIPFFSGTYFPKQQSFGRPAFKNLLSQVAHFYYQRKDAIEKLSLFLSEAFIKIDEKSKETITLNDSLLKKARIELEKSFDFLHGGFGREPKFPMPTHLENLLQYYETSLHPDNDALSMVINSLTRMAQGGLFDQIGGGFFRYCVDAAWVIPHFEKMLYDNAQLIFLYTAGKLVTDQSFFQEIAYATYDWLMREMHAEAGGFYSSINADSEGEEGKFYVWDREEIAGILNSREYYLVESIWGLKQLPNFEGKWHLRLVEKGDPNEAAMIAQAKQKLLASRQTRVFPSRDTKILTAWNALVIKSLVFLGNSFTRPDIINTAKSTLDFLKNSVWQNNRLFSVYKDGTAYQPAFLDDYAFLMDALIHYLQVDWGESYFNWLLALADQLCEYFFDEGQGGFFYTAKDQESLIYRPKSLSDEAIPSGNGIAVLCLLRLGNFLGNVKYFQAAEKTLQYAWDFIEKSPSSHNTMLMALREYLQPSTFIILKGDKQEMKGWQEIVAQRYLPNYLCYAIPNENTLPEYLQKPQPESGVIAYFCQGQSCQKSISNLIEFENYFI